MVLGAHKRNASPLGLPRCKDLTTDIIVLRDKNVWRCMILFCIYPPLVHHFSNGPSNINTVGVFYRPSPPETQFWRFRLFKDYILGLQMIKTMQSCPACITSSLIAV